MKIWCNDKVDIVPMDKSGHCSGCGHVVETTAGEVTLGCVVEAVGTIAWPEPDERWNSPQPCARVLDDEGFRHIVTGGQCFRNGTVIVPALVGKRGTIGVYHCAVIWFNLPTLFSG